MYRKTGNNLRAFPFKTGDYGYYNLMGCYDIWDQQPGMVIPCIVQVSVQLSILGGEVV